MSILSGIRKQKKYIKDENGNFKLASNWTSTDTVELSESIVNNDVDINRATTWDNTYDYVPELPTELGDFITKGTTTFKNVKYLKNLTDNIAPNIKTWDSYDLNNPTFYDPGIYILDTPDDNETAEVYHAPLSFVYNRQHRGILEVRKIHSNRYSEDRYNENRLLQIFRYFPILRYNSRDSEVEAITFVRMGWPLGSQYNFDSWKSDTYFASGESYTIPEGTMVSGYISSEDRRILTVSVPLPKRMDYVTIASNPNTIMFKAYQNGHDIVPESDLPSGCEWSRYKKLNNNLIIEFIPAFYHARYPYFPDSTAFDSVCGVFNEDCTITFG